MGKVLQDLIADADEDLATTVLNLVDGGNVMDPDFREIYHQIIELGTSAYGAAKAVVNSGQSVRDLKTLYYHAQEIEVLLLEYLGNITPKSVLNELKLIGHVQCPDELVRELEKLLEENEIKTEKWVTYTLIPL